MAVFSRSGVATVKPGTKTAVVNSVPLTSASLVLATLQNVLPGVMVQAVVPDPAHSKFTINLNKAPLAPATAKVGWFVVN